jgi:cell wall-associated NlpC family hydrolase
MNVRAVQTCVIAVCAALFIGWCLCGCAAKREKPTAPPPEAKTALRKAIVATALSLKGKLYKWKAKGPNSFDCSGFVYYVFKQCQINLPANTRELSSVGRKVNLKDVQPADLVFFKGIKVFHVGIMLNQNEFIHVSSQKGVAIDSLDSLYWKEKSCHFKDIL